MLLAIDAGNTNIVFALLEKGVIRFQWRITTHAERTEDEYKVWLHQLMNLEGLDPKAIKDTIITSVVPSVNRPLALLCRSYLGLEPTYVGDPSLDLGIEVKLPNKREVGSDRLVNAVAAYVLCPEKQIVIDFGTATTFDVIGADGSYVGGVISPGINLSLKALYSAAAKLPTISIRAPSTSVTGTSTEHAMQSGIYWGYIGLIEGIVARLKAENGDCRVISTGGLASLLAKNTDVINEIVPDLTIRGLYLIWKRQQESQA